MSNNKLTLSIVIPVHNEQRYLKTCLDAIAAQTEVPDEVIVVDNNSTDQSTAIARRYPFVRVVHEPRQGIVYARDTGFDAVHGDLIGRIDADTILPKDWVAYIKSFYAQQSQDVAWTSGCHYYNVRFPRLMTSAQNILVFRFNRLILGYNILWGSNAVIPKKLWKEVRTKVCRLPDIHEDIDLAIHLHRAGHQTIYDPREPVGAQLRRVRSERKELWPSLTWWPRTLRVHHIPTWPLAWIVGVWLLYLLSFLPPITEKIARLFGRAPLPD